MMLYADSNSDIKGRHLGSRAALYIQRSTRSSKLSAPSAARRIGKCEHSNQTSTRYARPDACALQAQLIRRSGFEQQDRLNRFCFLFVSLQPSPTRSRSEARPQSQHGQSGVKRLIYPFPSFSPCHHPCIQSPKPESASSGKLHSTSRLNTSSKAHINPPPQLAEHPAFVRVSSLISHSTPGAHLRSPEQSSRR
ncbi:hypothetical protein BU16DRAFT_333567 [Lophium mytilinum]|uniref:Uncharacterized protein n=1 Tax=Lophium mytilinum TaxID=390894 RepID=A0A6A6R048_9PEZI|nr:hypothetical protein BU16DRAFT_333567 [Lophium mytilinum]